MPANVYRRTPGVYVTELAAFPPSIVAVQTAVPAFIGYTEKAEISGKPVYMKPIRVGSMVDYEEMFGGAFRPLYDIEPATDSPIQADDYDFKVVDPELNTQYYRLVESLPVPTDVAGALADEPVALPRFNLYNSLRLFYANGGTNCYVVSVGNYESGAIDAELLEKGLDVIKEQKGPTMLAIPDAVLLAPAGGPSDAPWTPPVGYTDLVKAMLDQCGALQDRIALIDVYGSNEVVDQSTLDSVIGEFQKLVPDLFASYGAAYFPFLHTTVVPASEISYQNISATSFDTLKEVLGWENDRLYPGTSRHGQVTDLITEMKPWTKPATPAQGLLEREVTVRLNQNLVAALPLLGDIERIILAKNQVLPPSGAMAGAYTLTDFTKGVWNAPANLSLAAVTRPTYKLTGEQQGELNIPINGKAVDAIREFTGRGTVVWGARTLDGNSNDYRYVQVRRTLIYIEQSIKAALDKFVFAPNDGNTWASVVAMSTSFLQGVWSQGGLMGATPADAFTVQCGLGTTMTPQDILDGYMRVQVVLQMIRPAEFIELTFTQKMEGLG
jgi:hypothetical protein